jgi:hypothetical protein
MSTTPSTSAALDRDFLALRARLVDLAAGLDRIDRESASSKDDPRWRQLRRAVDVLASSEPNRAERMQMHFSLPYDPAWREKT